MSTKVNFDIIIICSDVIGEKIAGPAIRCVEIAKYLSKFYEVLLASPKINDKEKYLCRTISTDDPLFRSEVFNANIVIFQGDALKVHPFLKEYSGVLIADLYCPIPLEYHQVSEGFPLETRLNTASYLAEMVHEQLVYADHFLCASERQKEFWLGSLTLAGRINALRWPIASHADVSQLISLLPFGLDSHRPQRDRHALRDAFSIPYDDFVMVWGGGIYQWFDPLTIIRALHRLIKKGFRVHLVFMGVKHPNPSINEHDMCGSAVALSKELGLFDQFVHFNFGWVDYSDRHNFLFDADIGVSAHFDNPETRYSFRTRMLDYLWAGLPIVATKGDVFGDALDANSIGVAVDFEDVDGWVAALEKMITMNDFRAACRAGSERYAQAFRWDIVTKPLLNLCAQISTSPDREYVRTNFCRGVRRQGLGQRVRGAFVRGGLLGIASAAYRFAARRFR